MSEGKASVLVAEDDARAGEALRQMLSDEAVAEFYGMIGDHLPLLASGVPNGVRTSWGYRIDTDFDMDVPGLVMDETPPLGEGSAPRPLASGP